MIKALDACILGVYCKHLVMSYMAGCIAERSWGGELDRVASQILFLLFTH